DETVWVWDAATGTPIGQPFTGHTDDVNAVAVGQVDDRPVVVSGGADATVRVWDAANLRTYETTEIHLPESAYGTAFNVPGIIAIATTLGVISVRLEH
ncbi:hypothetical protein ACFHVL_15265, partial [Micromonospora sp. LOL_023]